MNFSALFKRAGKAAAENSPAILTALAVTGTVTTAILAAKAAFKSVDVLKDAEEAKKDEHFGDVKEAELSEAINTPYEPMNFKEQFNAVWKLYVPAATCAALTITAIIVLNREGERRAAILTSAYSASDKAFKEYRQKVTDKIGKNKEQAVRDDIAQDRVNKTPPPTTMVPTPEGQTLCMDSWSGRYFVGDIESIRKAVNDFNEVVLNQYYGTLSEFWDLLGLEGTAQSDHFGWSSDKKLEVHPSFVTINNEPVIMLSYLVEPRPRPDLMS